MLLFAFREPPPHRRCVLKNEKKKQIIQNYKAGRVLVARSDAFLDQFVLDLLANFLNGIFQKKTVFSCVNLHGEIL